MLGRVSSTLCPPESIPRGKDNVECIIPFDCLLSSKTTEPRDARVMRNATFKVEKKIYQGVEALRQVP